MFLRIFWGKNLLCFFVKCRYSNGNYTTKSNRNHYIKGESEKVVEFMKQEGKDNLLLRVYVSGGGCSGLSYGMGFEEKADEDDKVT